MIDPATPQDDPNTEFFASESKQSFQLKNYQDCIKYADAILAIWSNAKPRRRKEIHKDVLIVLYFGSIACLKKKDVERGMAFYEHALGVKKVCWELGIRVANHLVRLKDTERLLPVIERLRTWAPRNPKHERQLEALMKKIGEGSPLRPKKGLVGSGATNLADHSK